MYYASVSSLHRESIDSLITGAGEGCSSRLGAVVAKESVYS